MLVLCKNKGNLISFLWFQNHLQLTCVGHVGGGGSTCGRPCGARAVVMPVVFRVRVAGRHAPMACRRRAILCDASVLSLGAHQGRPPEAAG